MCLDRNGFRVTGAENIGNNPIKQVLVQVRLPEEVGQITPKGPGLNALLGRLVTQGDRGMPVHAAIHRPTQEGFLGGEDRPIGSVPPRIGHWIDFKVGHGAERGKLPPVCYHFRTPRASTLLDIRAHSRLDARHGPSVHGFYDTNSTWNAGRSG
jgi:hypothetical protein